METLLPANAGCPLKGERCSWVPVINSHTTNREHSWVLVTFSQRNICLPIKRIKIYIKLDYLQLERLIWSAPYYCF